MNWLKQNWIKAIVGMVILGVATSFYLWKTIDKNTLSLKCPDSFKNADEKNADLKVFADAYYAKHPNAAETDLAKEMVNQWKANNCTEALKRYNDYITGNVSANTTKIISGVVDEYTNSFYYENTELGFSFQYPNSLTVSDKDPKQPYWVVLFPKSKLSNDSEPLTAIIISEADDSPEMTAEQWLNGPNSGYKASRDGKYRHITVGGQDAVVTTDDWTVVKSPDGQKRISIAYLVNKGAQPLKNELQTIIDTFAFK